MAAFVACTKLRNASGASANGTVSATASNALMALCNEYNPVAGTLTVTGGGTWTTDANGTVSSLLRVSIASCPSATGGSNTITTTFSAGAGTTSFIYEFSGMASPVLDAVGTAKSGTSASPSTNSLTNGSANAVFVADAITDSGAALTIASTGTGWTIPTNGTEPDGTTQLTAMSAYKIVSSIAADSESWSDGSSANWSGMIASYLQSGGGGGGLPFFMQEENLMVGGVTAKSGNFQ